MRSTVSSTLSVRTRWLLTSTIAASLMFIASLPAASQCDVVDEKTPARGVPSQLWGELAPIDVGKLPNPRDNTDWNQIGDFETHPYAISLDVEENWVFLAQNRRFQIWNGATAPGSFNVPAFDIGLRSMENAGLVYTDSGHSFFVFEDIDAPPNNSDVVSIVGVDGMGMAVYETSNKTSPRLIYQDHGGGRYAKQVYVTTIGGRHYAFVAGSQATALPGGAFVYDLSAALANSTPPACIEARPSGPVQCPGVYLGKLGARSNVRFIDGAGDLVVLSSTFSPDGIEIYNVASPANPQLRLTGLTSDAVYGVAMWQQGSSYYVALRTSSQARIYDVSCAASGSCSLGSPLWTQNISVGGSERTVTFSRSGTTPFVYYGTSSECISGNQNEWLFDVSNPSSPNDISPQGTVTIGGEAVSYWGWYYWDNGIHGFNRTAPRMGKFFGDFFFRAGYAIFDVHRRTSGSPPNASFTWSPPQVYPNTSINFTDTSSGAPNAWDWDFLTDGVPNSSSSQNPSGIRFPTTGNKTINLDVSNAAGSDSATMTLQVLAPEPNVNSVSASPNPALVCQPVTLTAQGVTGQPTLSFAWDVKDTSGATVATGTTNPFVWESLPADANGSPFTAEVTVSNTSGTDSATSASIVLNPLTALPTSGSFTPVIVGDNPPSGAEVEFMVTASGATEWNWNFGDNPGGGPDNDGYEGWTSDPVAGPNPTHVYTAIGTYPVRVKVRNCQESEQESAALSVAITNVVPVTANFEPNLFCQAGSCFADTNQAITFIDNSTGPPTSWDYDWDGNGNFEDVNNTSPVTSHTYTSPGNFTPRLRVRLNGQTDIYTLPFVIRVENGGGGGGNPPRITISGPTTGVVNQNVTLTASAANCTPTANGWVWTAAGATGTSTSSSIQLSWATAGNKAITARNSNASCGTASDNHIVIISGGGGGGGGTDPVANFTFSPTSPVDGQTVSFNGTSSTGNPTGYSWTFGDGTSGTGSTTSHVYQNPGSYPVTLEVTRQDSGCTFGVCSDQETRTVVVGSSGPPPVVARFTVNTFCGGSSGQEICDVDAGQVVNFTDTSTGPVTSRQWTFGDGTTSSAANPSHSYSQGGSFLATLTVTGATNQDSASRTFNVAPPPQPEGNVIVPWVVTQDNEALVQTSALYLHNPDSVARQITMRFHRRRASSDGETPPESVQNLAAGATVFFPDVLQGVFGLSNVSGFLELEVSGDNPALPTAVSYQRTFPGNGLMFGHAVPEVTPAGFPTSSTETGSTFHLMGLNDNGERLAFFGVANPNPAASRFQLRFYNSLGESVGITPPPMAVGSLNQRQFEVSVIRNTFGLTDVSDYRIDLEVLTNGPLYMYGANLRLQTEDPSYLRPGEPGASKVYLLGVLATQGLNDSLFRTDGLISNVTNTLMQAEMVFTPVGLGSEPLPPATLTLLPGETLRLANVLQEQFGLADDNNLGYLSIESAGVDGVYPLVQAESYDTANPDGRFGQSMPALTEEHIGEAGERHILTGLQQDAQSRSTIWLMNPGTVRGEYDLIYRNLSGTEVGRISAFRVPRGGMRQLNPEFHPLPGGVIDGGFTVQIIIRTGTLLSGAQVVDNDTNDPAFVAGARR